MNHVVDHLAHAVLRGGMYRMIWHSPAIFAALAVFVAIVYLARRYP